jgi:hypothetical protein
MPDANEPTPPTDTEQIRHSLGDHLTLIVTHADHIGGQLALPAVVVEAN